MKGWFFTHVSIANTYTIAYWYWILLKFDNNSSPMGYLRVNPEKGQLSIELCTMCDVRMCIYNVLHVVQMLNSHKELSYSFEYLSHFVALFGWFLVDFRRKIVVVVECSYRDSKKRKSTFIAFANDLYY